MKDKTLKSQAGVRIRGILEMGSKAPIGWEEMANHGGGLWSRTRLGEVGGLGGWQRVAWLWQRGAGPGSRLWLGLRDGVDSFVVSHSWEADKEGEFRLVLTRRVGEIGEWDRRKVDRERTCWAVARAGVLLLEVEKLPVNRIKEWLSTHVEAEPLWEQDLTVREGLRVLGVPRTPNEVVRFWARLVVGDMWARSWGLGEAE